MKKVVFKLEFYDEKIKQKAMQSVSGLSGVESVSVDMEEKKLTVIGDIDPVKMAAKLRKICHTDILTVGPAKEPEKKKDDQPAAAAARKKDEPKKEEPKKMSIVLPPKVGGGNGGGGGGGGGGDGKKKDVKALVPVTGFPPAAGPGPGPGPVLHHQGQLVKSFPEPYHYVQYPPAQALQPYNHYNQYPPAQALQPYQQYQQYAPPLPAPAYYGRSPVEEDPNSCVIC